MAVYITKNGRLQMARLFRSAIGGVRYNHLTAANTNSSLLDGATNGLLEAPGLSDGKAKESEVFSAYIVSGSTEFSSGWLSATEDGDALVPKVYLFYRIATDGDYKDNVYRWDESESVPAYVLVEDGSGYPEYSKGYEGAVGSGDRGVTGFYIALGYDPRHNIAVNNEYVLDNRTWLFAHRIFPSLEVGSTSAPSLPFTAFVNYCVPYGEASADELASSDGSAVVNGTSYLLLKDTYVDAAGAISYGGGGDGEIGGDNGYNGLLDRESGVRTPVLLYVSVVLSASLIKSAMARIGYGTDTPEGVSETDGTILAYPDMCGRLNPAQRFNMVGYFMFNATDDRYYGAAGDKFVRPTVDSLDNYSSYKASKVWMQFKKRAVAGVAPLYQAIDSTSGAADAVVNAMVADDLFVQPGVGNKTAPFVPNDSTLISWEVWGETPIAPTSSDTLRLQTVIRF